MKFKVTRRNKLDGCIEYNYVDADSEKDAHYELEAVNYQVLSARSLRPIGEKQPKETKSTYVSIKRLRAQKERDLSNKQMNLGKYSPEAIAAQRVKEQLENAKDLANELEMD